MPCFQRSMGPAKWRNPGWVLPFWMIGGIEILVCLSCFCFSVYVYRNHGVSTSRPDGFIAPSLKYMNLCGVISFLCCSIMQCINVWYWNVYYDIRSLIQTMFFFCSVPLSGACFSFVLFPHPDQAFSPRPMFWQTYIFLWRSCFQKQKKYTQKSKNKQKGDSVLWRNYK